MASWQIQRTVYGRFDEVRTPCQAINFLLGNRWICSFLLDNFFVVAKDHNSDKNLQVNIYNKN